MPSLKVLLCYPTDIAETSVQQCRERYKSDKMSRRSKPFEAEFIVADCTKVSILLHYWYIVALVPLYMHTYVLNCFCIVSVPSNTCTSNICMFPSSSPLPLPSPTPLIPDYIFIGSLERRV